MMITLEIDDLVLQALKRQYFCNTKKLPIGSFFNYGEIY